MTLAKICGLCRPADAAVAAAAGAAYAGVILAPGRSRTRTVSEADAIFAAATGVLRAGVFADAVPADVVAAARALRLDVVQLHGNEPPAVLEALRRAGVARLWKAVAVRAAADARAAFVRYGAVADAILLDGGSGGRGETFDWDAVSAALPVRPAGLQLVVAGGLTPDNVQRAIAALAPDVVDVSSGVEAAPGEKSEASVRAFVAAVARAAP